MEGSAAAHSSAHGRATASEIGAIVGAAVLVGAGITGLAYWLITFHWLFLGSVIPLAAGGLLLFSRWTGPDRA
ncbi:MAG TPA: hypothetical protein VML53_01115 [Thermoplasmata archaeon]|nr:hypothetical protein [Thermoplasmata archaeon]